MNGCNGIVEGREFTEYHIGQSRFPQRLNLGCALLQPLEEAGPPPLASDESELGRQKPAGLFHVAVGNPPVRRAWRPVASVGRN